MIKRLDHVHVVAKDMDASIEFYTKALGFRLLRRVRFGPGGERQLSYVGLGDMMIELVQPGPRRGVPRHRGAPHRARGGRS